VPDFTQAVEPSFVIATIAAIFLLIGLGIVVVKMFKKVKKSKS